MIEIESDELYPSCGEVPLCGDIDEVGECPSYREVVLMGEDR